jgi:hypothetical protein
VLSHRNTTAPYHAGVPAEHRIPPAQRCGWSQHDAAERRGVMFAQPCDAHDPRRTADLGRRPLPLSRTKPGPALRARPLLSESEPCFSRVWPMTSPIPDPTIISASRRPTPCSDRSTDSGRTGHDAAPADRSLQFFVAMPFEVGGTTVSPPASDRRVRRLRPLSIRTTTF